MIRGFSRSALAAAVVGVLAAAVQVAPAGATAPPQVPLFSTPMTVSAVLGGSSTINVSPMNFGNVQNQGFGKNLAVSTIVYQGAAGNTITIGPGLGNCGGSTRCMTDNADPNQIGVPNFTHVLSYMLYKDPGRTLPWGDGTLATGGATGVSVVGASQYGQPATPGVQTLFVYGAITQNAGFSGGTGATFTDTVMVTING